MVDYFIQERIAHISINRPEKRNALNRETVQALKNHFSNAAQNNEVKVIILSGKGKAFCSGADLAYLQELQEFSDEENLQDSTELMELFHLIYTIPKPVIAQVNGPALAGGCGLVSVCDFAFCTTDSKFGYTEVRIGFIPAIVMVFLIRKIGEANARRLLISGEIFECEFAEASGLITKSFEKEETLEHYVLEFAQNLCTQNSATAMSLTKELLNQIRDLDLNEGLQTAVKYNVKARKTDDCKKGIHSFLNKEKLRW
jgi:methylglutaconyl-CoA hydratase